MKVVPTEFAANPNSKMTFWQVAPGSKFRWMGHVWMKVDNDDNYYTDVVAIPFGHEDNPLIRGSIENNTEVTLLQNDGWGVLPIENR